MAIQEYDLAKDVPPAGIRFYSPDERNKVEVLRTTWGPVETVCGREDIIVAEDGVVVSESGTHTVNIVKGDKEALDHLAAFRGIVELLDASARLDDAVDAGDKAAIGDAENEIRGMGMGRIASATSDDTEL